METFRAAQDEASISKLEKVFRSAVYSRGKNPFIEDERNFATREAEWKVRQRDVRLTLFPRVQELQMRHLQGQRRTIDKRREHQGDEEEKADDTVSVKT